PLCTLTLLLEELRATATDDGAPAAHDIVALLEQAGQCRRIISDFVLYAGGNAVEGDANERVDESLAHIAEKWRRLRPRVELACRLEGPQPAPRMTDTAVIRSALINLLNNAADASP